MSRSQPALQNPATRFFTWKGGEGRLEFWDKEISKAINVPLPFEFMVLDELSTITGYSEHDESGYWSNETRNILKDELHVKTRKGTRYIGLYKNDQGIVQMPQGAKYAKSIYIAYKTKNGYEIGNIKAAGAALTSWIEFSQNHQVGNGKVRITGANEAKKGATTYWVPTFEWDHTTADEDGTAIALDKTLQVYLSHYLAAAEHNRSNETEAEEKFDENYVGDTGREFEHSPSSASANEDDVPGVPPEKQGAAKAVRNWDNVGKGRKDEDAEAQSLYNQAATSEDFGDEQIDISQIPF